MIMSNQHVYAYYEEHMRSDEEKAQLKEKNTGKEETEGGGENLKDGHSSVNTTSNSHSKNKHFQHVHDPHQHSGQAGKLTSTHISSRENTTTDSKSTSSDSVFSKRNVDSSREDKNSGSDSTDSSRSRNSKQNSNEGKQSVRTLTCVQTAGDVIFVPENWGHGVLNLQQSVAVATEATRSLWRINPAYQMIHKYIKKYGAGPPKVKGKKSVT